MQHAARLNALTVGLDAPLLVSRLSNLRYLIGFTGTNGYLLARPDGTCVFFTDGRYAEKAEELVAGLPAASLLISGTDMWEGMGELLNDLDRVALESHGVTWDFAETLREKTGTEPVPTRGLVEELRRAKDEEEVGCLRRAAAAGDAAFGALAGLLEQASTEADLAWGLIGVMRDGGADVADWDPIVAAGPAASLPHYEAADQPLGQGLLLLDYGCTVGGYHSDMSRTVWLEGEPDDEMERVYRAVAESQQAGIAAVGPGIACGDVDEAVRQVLRGYGYEEQFVHGTGHGVGLEIHEAPFLRRGSEEALQVGDVVTVEPGVYLPAVGGVRIEDMVLVGADGSEVLTASPREFVLR
jgi:Xaa-Pro aminopeptidase